MPSPLCCHYDQEATLSARSAVHQLLDIQQAGVRLYTARRKVHLAGHHLPAARGGAPHEQEAALHTTGGQSREDDTYWLCTAAGAGEIDRRANWT